MNSDDNDTRKQLGRVWTEWTEYPSGQRHRMVVLQQGHLGPNVDRGIIIRIERLITEWEPVSDRDTFGLGHDQARELCAWLIQYGYRGTT